MTLTATSRDDDLAQRYADNGIVQVSGVLDPDELDELRETFTEQVERDNSIGHDDGVPSDDVLARYPRFIHPHRRPDLAVGRLARRYLLDPRIVGLVEAMIGPALGAQSMFYFKPPTARGQALHQDNLFLRAHPETCLAVWIAVDPVDDLNGGLRIVPGSHRFDLVCPGEADKQTSFSRQAIHLPEGLTTEPTALQPGDALFFHGSLVHGSGPNRTVDRFRRSLIFHYVPRASTELAKGYQPLLAPDGSEVWVDEAEHGGICGDGWVPTEPR